jgi:class 3 adenylate cyclase
VHIAARILGQAGGGEILVSRTVRDLVVGSATAFEDRGSVELRGVPGSWQLPQLCSGVVFADLARLTLTTLRRESIGKALLLSR